MRTPRCKLGTGRDTCPREDTLKYVQSTTTTESTSHGVHADNASGIGSLRSSGVTPAFGEGPGVQTRRNDVSARMETIALTTSVAYGPQKFETRNWVVANVAPVTNAAGQARRNP